MRRTVAALLALSAVEGLLLALAACSTPGPSAPPQFLDGYGLSDPHTHANLTVFLLTQKGASQEEPDCMTLEEAFRLGTIKVTEKADGAQVNELCVENVGDKPVYLQAGDTVKGGQQDRTIAVDSMLPPHSGKRPIDAFCVEPGRWHERSASGASGRGPLTGASFSLAEAPVASNAQKLAIRLEKDQGKVWAAGESLNGKLAAPRGVAALEEPKNSYVEALETPAVKNQTAERVAALENIVAGQRDAVGAVFCLNGKIQSIELYASAGLFRKFWPKLLRSATVEAIGTPSDAPAPPPSERDVRTLLSGFGKDEGKVEQRADGHAVRVVDREKAAYFETEADGRMLHRQVLTK